jgi:hypothetical protein
MLLAKTNFLCMIYETHKDVIVSIAFSDLLLSSFQA